MITISRKDGMVTGSFTEDQMEELWGALVSNLGPGVLQNIHDKKKERDYEELPNVSD